ncbi:hypothetical protein EV127DRAFT_353264 [Xylaria flabelliformis]|nr:hypothetical protein EV127DRAFT_353264 [Xylaria flabelliformis]
MSIESVQSWASKSRTYNEHHSVEAQHIIDIFEKLFLNRTSPADAAYSINKELYPLMQANPSDLRITSVWGIVCHAVRSLGSDRSISLLVVQMLDAMRKIEIKGEDGNNIRKDWGGYFWKDLPGFSLTFREYGIDLEPDEGLTDSEWLAQKTHFHNATSFAAIALAASPQFSGFIFFFLVCMGEAFGGVDDEPAPQARAAMYIPAVLAWLANAGDRIYQMSKEGTQKGLDMDTWLSWKNSLDQVAADTSIEDDMRRLALEAKNTMDSVETRFMD